MEQSPATLDRTSVVLPQHRDLFYAGKWQAPQSDRYQQSTNPADGTVLGEFAEANSADVEAAVAAARAGFEIWCRIAPAERAAVLRQIGATIRNHAEELAYLDTLDGGNPVTAARRDVQSAAGRFDYFAGLVTEMKGESVPMAPGRVNFSVREPLGVVVRIVAFNHPFLFSASRLASPLAAGNAVILKPPEQASLPALRLVELIGGLLPDGVLNVLTGGKELGEALVSHEHVAMVGLVGSVQTGRAIMRSASDTLKRLLFELGGKNALIAFPDADPVSVARAAVDGMNFTWCGQSCGSTSRIFLHDDIHDAVVAEIRRIVTGIVPGIPHDSDTRMGAIISAGQHRKVMHYIQAGLDEGATLLCGGTVPEDPALQSGFFINPTVFTGVEQHMRIAREEIFGPVMSVLRWNDAERMLVDVNSVPYGLTCAIWTKDLITAHRTAAAVEAGYVWVNEVGRHFLGAPFGGYKQSGRGREECLAELMSFTQEKNIHLRLDYSR